MLLHLPFRINLLYRKAILLGAKHRTMAAVAEKAFDYLCENVLSITDEFISMEPIYLTAILSRDELNVCDSDRTASRCYSLSILSFFSGWLSVAGKFIDILFLLLLQSGVEHTYFCIQFC